MAPAIILVRAQLGANIGAAARAMLNCNLTDLRLVAPREGWPNDHAIAPASGADKILDNITVYDDLPSAVADCQFVLGASARKSRELVLPVFDLNQSIVQIKHHETELNAQTAILFGPEASGLSNNDLAVCDGLLTIPLNPKFSSLNLAQAVLLVAYHYWSTGDMNGLEDNLMYTDHPPAPKGEVGYLIKRLDDELQTRGFYPTPEMAPHMKQTINNLFHRIGLSEKEVKVLHGVISALIKDGSDY
jgi:tRNA/rRNA methyltransferase